MAENKKSKALVARVVARTYGFLEGLSGLSRKEALNRKVRAAAVARRAEIKAKTAYGILAASIIGDLQALGLEEVVVSSYAYAQLKAPSRSILRDEEGAKVFDRLIRELGEDLALQLVEVSTTVKVSTAYRIKDEVCRSLSPSRQVKVLEAIGNKPVLVVDFPTAAAKSGKDTCRKKSWKSRAILSLGTQKVPLQRDLSLCFLG